MFFIGVSFSVETLQLGGGDMVALVILGIEISARCPVSFSGSWSFWDNGIFFLK